MSSSTAPVAFPVLLDPAWYYLQRVAHNLYGSDVAVYERSLWLVREKGYGTVDNDGVVTLPEGGHNGACRIVHPPSPYVILDDGTIKTRRQIDDEEQGQQWPASTR